MIVNSENRQLRQRLAQLQTERENANLRREIQRLEKEKERGFPENSFDYQHKEYGLSLEDTSTPTHNKLGIRT